MAEVKDEKKIIFFDDNIQNIRDMMENIPNIRAILVDATNIKHRYIKKHDELYPAKIAMRPYKDGYMTNAAFFNTETNKYTNKYSEYVDNPRRGEFHMPTEAITGTGRDLLINEKGAESLGIFANNTSFIYTFIADNSISNNRKVVIFDWDRTLTSIEGWYPEFFKDLYSNYTTDINDPSDLPEPTPEFDETTYKKAIADTAQYLFGGPERERTLKNMFSFLHANNISVFIITNNSTASEVFLEETGIDSRKIFLGMIKIVYPQFIDSHLISTYQGKNKGMVLKSEAYTDFIAEEAGKEKATEGGGQYKQSNIKRIKQKTINKRRRPTRQTKRKIRRIIKRRNTTNNSKIKGRRLKTTQSEKAVRRNS
jgi:hypothetical protein